MTNHELESCKRDIEIIRSTIEKSKVNLGAVSRLFIIYGTATLLLSLIRRLCLILITPIYTAQTHQILSIVNPITQMILSAVLLFFYLKNYFHLKKHNHSYTLQLFKIWGVAMFAIPLFVSLVNCLAEFIYQKELYQSISIVLVSLLAFSEGIFFLTSLFYTGIVLGKRMITVSSIAMFVLMVFIYFVHPEIPHESYFHIHSYIDTRTWFCRMIVMIGYIFIGIYLYPRKETKTWN